MNIQLSIGITSNPRTWPVIGGAVKVEGVDFTPSVLHPSELFWRQLRFAEFDVAEMSMSSLMMAKSKGDERFVGIPVFTTRMFFHTRILVRKGARIDKPSDLKGKRVGVPEYQQTAALWIRGAMQHEFGVEPKDMEFWMERSPSKSHGGATGFKTPPGVAVNQVPPDKNLGTMMLAGELDAVMFYLVDPNLIDRSTADLHNHSDIKPLFADAVAESVRYYRETGLYPINHGMVIKRELAERHPLALTNILKAFKAASAPADRQRVEQAEYYFETGILPAAAQKAFAAPLITHGVIANRKVLETIAAYSLEQGLTPKLTQLEDLYPPSMISQ